MAAFNQTVIDAPPPALRRLRPTCRKALLASVLLLAASTLTGCSKPPRAECFPVRGQVTRDGTPLADVMVVLHPLFEPALAFSRPLAHSGPDGKFALMTYETADGAPAGEYAITLELRDLRPSGEEMIRDGKNLLPPRYAQPSTTPLRFTVKAGENEIPPIAIPAR